MSLIYIAGFRAISLTANGSSSQDIWELVNGTGQSLELHHLHLESQYNVDERIDLQLLERSATGSGGSAAITPNAVDQLNTRASGITSFKTLVTTPGAAVANGGMEPFQWSELAPLDLLWTPEDRPSVAPGGRIVLSNLNTFVAATRTVSGWLKWSER